MTHQSRIKNILRITGRSTEEILKLNKLKTQDK